MRYFDIAGPRIALQAAQISTARRPTRRQTFRYQKLSCALLIAQPRLGCNVREISFSDALSLARDGIVHRQNTDPRITDTGAVTPAHSRENNRYWRQNMGSNVRDNWMSRSRQLSVLLEKFQLDPTDEKRDALLRDLTEYQRAYKEGSIQLPVCFTAY